MATANESRANIHQGTSASHFTEGKGEKFRIRCQYLKSETSVQNHFVGNLPEHISNFNTGNIWKGIETSYGNYNVFYKQDFTTTRPKSIEEDVCQAWFSNKPSSEDMAWMEIVRDKRSYSQSARNGRDLSFPGVRVDGGSMISPVTFVSHWKLSTNYQKNLTISFQAESSKLIIKKDVFSFDNEENSFALEVTYESLYDTIIIQKTDERVFILFNLKSNPKIYENAGNSRVIAEYTGCGDMGYLNTYRLEFDTTRHQYSEIDNVLSRFMCIGFNVAHAELRLLTPHSEPIDFPQNNFEVEYAWMCVKHLGYKVLDHITLREKEHIEQLCRRKDVPASQIFYDLAVQLNQKPFFSFTEELDMILNRSKMTESDEEVSSFSKVPRIVITPTKLLCLPKELVFQNRILRQYGEEYFIKVVIRDEDFSKISMVQSSALDSILKRIEAICNRGFKVNGRLFDFLGCSNSQLREHSFWFFHPHDGITSEGIRNNSGDLSSEKCVASYVSRFGLCFSSTQETIDIDSSCVVYMKDVRNENYCFTDGIGCISPHLAKRVAKTLNIHPVPSAFQIRFGGCKGVVAQWPSLGYEKDLLYIGDSMKKFHSKSHNLEIIEITKPGRLHLNRQVITLLSGLGIPDHVFLNLQERMLIDMADMLLDDEKALSALLETAIRMDFAHLARRGISFVCEPFFRSLLHSIYNHKLTNLMEKTRIQIPLDKGRYMMGTSDETKSLTSGQVFIQYSKETNKPGENVIVFEGVVAVTKNPCFHEGDIRVFKAVNVPSLSHMVDCIVFPQVGQRPHPDEMSGSDLDGDMYFVCWDEQLCKFENCKPMDFPKAQKKCLTREVESHDIIEFIADYIRNDKLGLIANAHLVQADINENGIFSKECHKLAEMHSEAVDGPKTGKFPDIDAKLRPQSYPDFMMKSDKKMHPSTKCIGKLFRQCRILLRMHKQPVIDTVNIDMDRDFSFYEIDDKTLQKARQQKYLYDQKVLEVLDLYGIKTEAEAITGLVQSFNASNGCLKNEKFEVEKMVKEKIGRIQKQTRKIFFDEFGGELNVQKTDIGVMWKALAWYQATYASEDTFQPILSFPWIVADVLVILKKSTNVSRVSTLGLCLQKYYNEYKNEQKREMSALNRMKHIVETLLAVHRGSQVVSNFNVSIVGLEVCGILKSQTNLNIAIDGLPFYKIHETLEEKGIERFNIKGSQDPYYFISNSGKQFYARFLTDKRLKALSRFMEMFLVGSTRHLRPIVQFLCDILQNIFPVHSNAYIFLDVVAAVVVYCCLPPIDTNVITNPLAIEGSDTVKCLLAVLKNFILNFKYTNVEERPTIKDGLDALNVNVSYIPTIKEKFIMTYQKIAFYDEVEFNPFLQIGKRFDMFSTSKDFEDNDMYRVYNLPESVLGSILSAEEYVELQLTIRSGAEVSFSNRNKGASKFQVWGTEEAHDKMNEIVERISKVHSGKLGTEVDKGLVVMKEAYSTIFDGGCLESNICFKKYHDICQEIHGNQDKWVPMLRSVDANEGVFRNFEKSFVEKWNVLKSDYIDLLHGELCLNISFGVMYVMNIQCNGNLDIRDLNNLFANLDERKKKANKMMKRATDKKHVLYTFSFQPVVHLISDRIRGILETNGFVHAKSETKISIRLGKNTPIFCNFMEDGKLGSLNFSDVKWSMITVIPVESTNTLQPTHIRFRLQSYREVKRKDVGRIQRLKSLVHNGKILRTTPDGYDVADFINTNSITYSREKIIETYYALHSNDNFRGVHFKVEIAKVSELKLNPDKNKLVRLNSNPRVEVILSPGIPALESTDDEIRTYARCILEKALKLADEFQHLSEFARFCTQ